MKHVQQTKIIKEQKRKNLWCWLGGHLLNTTDISQSAWRDREHHVCERCKKEWVEIGFLKT